MAQGADTQAMEALGAPAQLHAGVALSHAWVDSFWEAFGGREGARGGAVTYRGRWASNGSQILPGSSVDLLAAACHSEEPQNLSLLQGHWGRSEDGEELPAWCVCSVTCTNHCTCPSAQLTFPATSLGTEIKMGEAGVYLGGLYPVGGETKERKPFIHPPHT